MSERLVINTGPLVSLARIGALEVCGRLPYAFICTEEVRAELDQGEGAGHPPVRPGWLHVERLRATLSPVAVVALDSGEAAVIQLAIESGNTTVCIDERRGRRAAMAAGLQVVGTLGLLAAARKKGIIPAMAPFARKALDVGVYCDIGLVNKVLATVGERL